MPDAELIRDVIDIMNQVPIENWEKDDTLGWVYQYYNEPDKEEVYGGLSNSEKIDNRNKLIAATQLYTEDYMVDYLVENSLGRLWLEQNPSSNLRDQMELFDPHPELQERPEMEQKPVEEITFFDPACGSGHFLLKAFDLFYEMYEEAGHEPPSIPAKIIENNLFGTDLDERAVQIAIIALYIKASAKKKDITGSKNLELTRFNLTPAHLGGLESDGAQWLKGEMGKSVSLKNIQNLLNQLDQIDTYGSLVNVRGLIKKMGQDEKSKGGFFSYDNFTKSVDRRKNKLFSKLKEMTQTDNLAEETLGLGSIRKVHLLSLLAGRYDVVATNPPYMNKKNIGGKVKTFLENNYSDYNRDVYASFIKACIEFSREFITMISMQSFMFISSFEELRKYILKNTQICNMAHLGTDAFSKISGEVVNTTMFTLRKQNTDSAEGSFIRLVDYNYEEKLSYLRQGLLGNTNNYITSQKTFDSIPGSPFVYWVSSGLRETFTEEDPLKKVTDPVAGLQTSDNARFLRLWWEINSKEISNNYPRDKNRWVPYVKGGPSKKWFGNLWWVVDWEDGGKKLQNYLHSVGQELHAQDYYFKEGITWSFASTKGFTMRYMPSNHIFDIGGSSLFPKKADLWYTLGFLNSSLPGFLVNVLNPTVNTQVGDFKRIPFKQPKKRTENKVKLCAKISTVIKKRLCRFSLIERNFSYTPLDWSREKHDTNIVDKGAKTYINHEIAKKTKVLLNESVIDKEVFKLYGLEDKDIQAIFDEEGKPVGCQPLLSTEDLSYLPEVGLFQNEFDLSEEDAKRVEKFRNKYAKSLPVYDLSPEKKKEKGNEALELYDDNKGLQDVCVEAEVNPLSVLRLVKETNHVPLKKGREIVQEFLFDKILNILREAPDGIVPLSPYTGKNTVYKELQRKLDSLGYETYEGFENYLKRGRTLEDWLHRDFFKAHSKRFSYSTYKGAIAWHLSSGKEKGFDVYVLHHKWSKDNLKKLRTVYLSNRKEFLENRLAQLDRDQQDKEWRKRREQLDEVEKMEEKLKELENEPDYNPEVDDGVGKNIAPLQDKGLISYDVLSKKQKKKYLEADW